MEQIPFPNKKYQIIYADPPWGSNSQFGRDKNKGNEQHYPLMTLQNIKDLPIKELADENCILFLWVVDTQLFDAGEVIRDWGFVYKTVGFSWYKKNKIASTMFFGLGYWTRANTEICLLATKGNPKRVDKGISQVIENLDFNYLYTEQIFATIREHSRKPDEVREKIVKLCGDLPRIELFAREQFEGWDAWGNQIECSIEL